VGAARAMAQLDRLILPDVADPRYVHAKQMRARITLGVRLADARGISCVKAISVGGHAAPTSTAPRTFLANDGVEYWVKRHAPSGLLAELAPGRLAALLSIGPLVTPIEVPWEALPRDGTLGEFRGTWFGSQHIPDGLPGRDIVKLLGPPGLEARLVDERSRALVIAFQTWINDEDSQVLVDLGSSRVFSIDHGRSFMELLKGPPSRVVVTPIAGVPDTHGLGAGAMDWALDQLEALSEQQILECVAGCPDGDQWHSLLDRRVRIAEWLLLRQMALREVMGQWTHRLS
jgi:hypothetical protein